MWNPGGGQRSAWCAHGRALDRFRPELDEKGICLHISPRRSGTAVIRESGMALQQAFTGAELARILSITALPEREVRFHEVPAGP